MTWTERWRVKGGKWGKVHTVDKHNPNVTLCFRSVPRDDNHELQWDGIPESAPRCKECGQPSWRRTS